MENYDLIIIGGGPAGYTASMYAAREQLKTLTFVGDKPGGQLSETTTIENFPGFPEPVDANGLMENMRVQAGRFGAEFIDDLVTEIDLSERPFLIKQGTKEYHADNLLIATGANPKKLRLENEDYYTGRGVSFCATCDGFFFRGKEVMVVGGGDSAMEEAIHLSKFASKVYVVHRRSEFRASPHNIKKAKEFENIDLDTYLNHEVVAYHGNDVLEAVTLKNNASGDEYPVNISGVFQAIGHVPRSELFTPKTRLQNILASSPVASLYKESSIVRRAVDWISKKTGQPVLDNAYIVRKPYSFETSVPGVYVAGDVCDSKYRQAVTAAGQGASAVLELIT